MATPPHDIHEEPAEEREHSFWASFSQADLRLFLLTFAGTVAANVVTVVVVAVALILARPPLSERPTPYSVLIFLAVVVFGTLGVYVTLTSFRRSRRRTRDPATLPTEALMLLTGLALGLLTLVFLLTLLGYAVGVK